MKSDHPTLMSFGSIKEHEAYAAVVTVWTKAKRASQMRHACIKQGRRKAARQLGLLKARCIQRACELAPDLIRRSVDQSFLTGTPSFWLPGHGRLHLPADLSPEYLPVSA